jgi:hypothetical protein
MMRIRSHIRLFSVLLAGLAGAGVLTVGFGLTPLSGSVLGSMLGLGPKGDFSLSSDSPLTLSRGQTGTITVTITSMNHLSGDVSLTATLATSSNNLPVVSISQSSVNLKPDETASFSAAITTTSSTSLGYYNITVQGKTGSLWHLITITVHVALPAPPPGPDFYLSASPSSMTVAQGSYTTGTLSVLSMQGFAGTISLFVSVYPLASNIPVVSLNLTSLKIPAGGTNSTTILVNASGATVGNYDIVVTGIGSSGSHTISTPFSVTGPVGVEALNVEASVIVSTTNMSLSIRNTGSVTTHLVSYYVMDASLDQYVLTSWNGPVISPNQLGIGTILIGASCGGCVRSGSAFNFTSNGSYRITLVTGYNNQFTFTIGQTTGQEQLTFDSYAFSSSTNVTLYLRNTGTVPVQLSVYSVRDASGDSYSLTSFAGPTIAVNQVVAVTFTIGSSCSGCTLSGNPFLFNSGYSYSIIITTSRNDVFTFTVAR